MGRHRKGDASLRKVSENGNQDRIKDILDRRIVNVNMKLDEGKTVLHVAASNGRAHFVDILCKSGAKINERDNNGLTPLCTAVSKNHLAVVKVLLNHGADPKGSFKMALEAQFQNIALVLLKYGTLFDICLSSCPDSQLLVNLLNILLTVDNVDVNSRILGGVHVKSFKCLRPLDCAIINGRVNLVKRLIELGADVNVKLDGGQTPLNLAVKVNHVSIVECLLNNGADVNCATNFGDTALSFAVKKASRIRSNDPDSRNNFLDMVRIIEMLLAKGASVNSPDKQGRRPLHYAAEINKFWPEIFRLLLGHGADVNAVDEEDATPIFYVENALIIEMLIGRGADVNYVSEILFTPLSQMFNLDRSSCVEVLLRNGADANIQNSEGKTILQVHRNPMTYYNNFDILEALINQTSNLIPAIWNLGHSGYDSASPDSIKLLTGMVVKRTVAKKISIDVETLRRFNKYKYFCSRIPMCEKEIVKMKNTKVKIGELSFFDILDMSIDNLSDYVERKELLKLKSDRIKKDFPMYAYILRRHIKQARNRRSLLDSSAETFKKLIFHHHEINLPYIVVQKIVSMLGCKGTGNFSYLSKTTQITVCEQDARTVESCEYISLHNVRFDLHSDVPSMQAHTRRTPCEARACVPEANTWYAWVHYRKIIYLKIDGKIRTKNNDSNREESTDPYLVSVGKNIHSTTIPPLSGNDQHELTCSVVFLIFPLILLVLSQCPVGAALLRSTSDLHRGKRFRASPMPRGRGCPTPGFLQESTLAVVAASGTVGDREPASSALGVSRGISRNVINSAGGGRGVEGATSNALGRGESGPTEEYPDPIECRPKTIKEKTQKSRRSLEQKYQRFSLKSEESISSIGSSCFTGEEKSRETNSTDVEFEEVKAFRDPEPNFSTEMQSMDMESKSNDRGQAFSSAGTQTNFETLQELQGMESTTDSKIIISVSVGTQTDFEDFDESKVVESQSTMKVPKVRSTGIQTSKRLIREISKSPAQRFEDSLRNDNDKCLLYTGLHFKYITVIMSFIGDVANSLNYWGSSRKSNANEKHKAKRKLTPLQELILVLTRLRCGLLLEDMSYRFEYKGHTTFKVLLGCTPNGAISFLSDVYEGAISDREIVIKSKLVDVLQPGDVVLADRGFTIEDLVESVGASLNIPPFLRQRNRFTAQEEIATKKVAKERIYVEHAIQKLKTESVYNDVNQSFSKAASNLPCTAMTISNNGAKMSTRSEEEIAFWEAASNGDEEKIKDALDKQMVDIHMKFEGETILHVAASNGHDKLVDFLCKSGVSINDPAYNRLTPLCTAVSKNHLDVVKVLLNHKADPKGSFRIALDIQSKSMVLILLEYGTLFDICLSTCSDSEFLEEFFNMLCSKPDFNVNDNISGRMIYAFDDRLTPLHLAAESGKDNIVKKLIELGADVNAKTRKKLTPLHCAVFNRHVRISECLLNNGADVNSSTNSGDTSLIFSTKNASPIRCDKDPRSEEKFLDFFEITKMLLAKGASVNCREDFNGFTPLHYGAGIDQSWPQIVRLLLDHGADINAVNKIDALPIFYAKNDMILEMLIEKGATVNYVSKTLFTPLSHMFTLNRSSCVEVLLRNGADVNIRNSHGKTMLEMNSPLVYYNNLELLEILINQTTDLNPAIRQLGESDQSRKFLQSLAAMIVKRKVTEEISIDLENLKTLSRYRLLCSLIPMCEAEINELKNKMVDIVGLSAFDILCMPINKLSNHVKRQCQELLQLETESIKVCFPFYGEILQWHIKQAKNRRSLIDSSAEALRKLIFHSHKIKLPDVVLHGIVPLLSNSYLINLAEV
ncbi:uncharacterized protein LOC117176690 [Belonocnema kinseyi]|uniref:uncharacterized protein LOC117176690 n=1 Tax=Belonocnema kinseyi TaxID=2817044 RepID=UPI00143DB0FC|nr:uncharacterized protein LOC117176690 [Belonocnema kinseyi]